jgi:hypothetical protein
MNNRIFWAAFALLAFMLVAAIAYAVHEQWVVYSQGSIVEVTIASLPGSLATNGTLKFEFDGKIESKNVNGNAARSLHIGDKIQMKHLNGHNMFLYIDENPIGWGAFVMVFLSIAGISCIYYAVKKTPPSLKM